ncbi:MAG TPA: Hsp20/alpha crystallin family protein [Burkholderiales bacterium]
MSQTEVTPTLAPQAPERVFRRTPEIEIVEDDQALWISAELPGVVPGDVEVSVEDGVLTLHGRVRQGSNGHATVVTEFARQLTLREPTRYDGERIEAVMRHGVLELRIPKHERAKRRQVPIAVH